MKERIVRHNSLDEVGGSESLNLRLLKMHREWQNQNHSIYTSQLLYFFSKYSLLSTIRNRADEHLISFSMSYIYTPRLFHRSNPNTSQLTDDPLLQTSLKKKPFLLTCPSIFLQKYLVTFSFCLNCKTKHKTCYLYRDDYTGFCL